MPAQKGLVKARFDYVKSGNTAKGSHYPGDAGLWF